jgi:hypothetical protein
MGVYSYQHAAAAAARPERQVAACVQWPVGELSELPSSAAEPQAAGLSYRIVRACMHACMREEGGQG